MRESNDWRLTNQESYLKCASLENRPYEPASQENDHDHCEFCFVKFTALAMPETRQEGYSTPDGYRWICTACYTDFKDLFDWHTG
jgi:Zn-finger protein